MTHKTPGFITQPVEELPSILFEGDEPASRPTPVRAPAPISRQRAWTREAPPETDVLPEAYGTGQLFLLARDPDCIYAHWDLPPEQQQRYNHLSSDRHLVLRVFAGEKRGQPFREIHLHPESQSWFVYVDGVAHVYVAELGYYASGGAWVSIADSDPVATPPEGPSAEKSVQFARLQPNTAQMQPLPVTGVAASLASPPAPAPAPAPVVSHSRPPTSSGPAQPVANTQPTTSNHVLASAPREERGPEIASLSAAPSLQAWPTLTAPDSVSTSYTTAKPAEVGVRKTAPAPQLEPLPEFFVEEIHWTESLDRSLEEIVTTNLTRNGASSMEHVETSRRVLEQELASMAAARRLRPIPLPGPVSSLPSEEQVPGEQIPSVSSQFEIAPPEQIPAAERKFWFMVNAELVIYGATEPTASVKIGERRIRLRPDGTFSYRFALPDGQYLLPIEAVSVDGEARSVALNFSRSSVTSGEVGKHPQDPALRPPQVEHVS